MAMNPLNQMFNGGGNRMPQMPQNGMGGMMPGMGNGGGIPGMRNPQQMMQTFMNMMNNKGGNGGQQMQQMLQNVSPDEYNKYLLQALTKFDEIYGKREGTLTHILFNSGLSIEQLQEAIAQYKGK